MKGKELPNHKFPDNLRPVGADPHMVEACGKTLHRNPGRRSGNVVDPDYSLPQHIEEGDLSDRAEHGIEAYLGEPG